MYLEVFLFDNFLMDLMLLRLAAAIAGRHIRTKRLLTGAAAGALLAWSALYLPQMISPMGKLLTGLLLTLTFPFTGRKAYLHAAAAVFAAAFLAGGAAFAAAFCIGETAGGLVLLPKPVRGMLAAFAAAMLLPRAVRHLRAQRRQQGFRCELVFFAAGKEYRLSALIDTGNLLAEPLSGRPAALVYLPELAPCADIPIPAKSIGGSSLLYALQPHAAFVNGQETDLLIALTEKPLSGTEALLPAAAKETSNEKGEAYAPHRQTHPFGIVPPAETRKARLLRQFRRGAAAAPFKGGGKRMPSPPWGRGGGGEGDAH